MKICSSCRTQLPDTYVACPNCGNTNLVMQQNDMYNQQYSQNQQMGGMQQQVGGVQPQQKVDKCGIGWLILSFLIPISGLILYFVWKSTKPESAKKCLIVGLVSWAIGFVSILLNK